jgi:hypothetical protein
MARYNEILVGRYNRFLQKLLGMKGSPPSPQLAGDIQPGIALFHGMENRFLESWRLYAASFNLGPTAAQTEACQIKNPTGSNAIGVIESVIFGSPGADFVTVSTSFNDPANLTNVFIATAMDPRQGTAGSSMLISGSAGGIVDLGFVVKRIRVAATSVELINDEHQQWLLLPTQAHRLRQETVNTTMVVSIVWRERALEEGERT